MSHFERQRAAEEALRNQENLLPKKQLIFTFLILALTLLVYFIDQNGIGQLLPIMAVDLNATQTISWAGTSSLIGNTVFQVLYGRLSDLFGRKLVYLSAIALLCFSDLLCGLSQNAAMLYVFRGLAGVAGGGITSLTMIVVSDIVTLQERGKYQGILGSCVGLGNLVGPLLASTFAEKTKVGWRGLFYMLAPTAAGCGVVHYFMLPTVVPRKDFRENVKKIDYLGVITASIALILLLIPISGGGAYFAWNSPMVISMLTIGSIFAVLFGYVEWRVSALPMMPFDLFKNMAISAIMIQNFFFGAVYYSYIYYFPIYFQNVRQWSPLKSAILIIPMVGTQACSSILSGQYITRTQRYGEIIIIGFFLFTLGTGLTILFDENFQLRYIIAIMVVFGYGCGNVFQPTIVALQAHARKSQRAVVISVRNFLRCLGGAVGLALSAAVLQNVLKASLPAEFKYLAASTFTHPDYSKFTATDSAAIKSAYAQASRAVFIMLTPLAVVCLITCAFVRDRGLIRPEELEAIERERQMREEEETTRQQEADLEKGMLDNGMADAAGGRSEVEVDVEKEKSDDITVMGKM
ncbi:putative MFS transporter [Rhizodiscina lignyota]|uniref:MFS transporter n=1 Tax=Rhizodiscina lignyota TaxID=1504668 RepID=A0A9P4IG59_9PEZI|nr:putative MFS transporter [Rhizodiscina lignyota]